MKRAIPFIILAFSLWACSTNNNTSEQSADSKPQSPNIILIMADDMGYECLSSNGSLSYHTPVLDSLANQGIRFTRCIAQPLCTPSRVKIMTGKRNYENYEYFGYLNPEAYTFGHLMKDKGYNTCIAGKWQLNGIYHKDQIPNWNDSLRPNKLGFDEYCLWQLRKPKSQGERFANPLIEQNGQIRSTTADDYGPDIFCNYILDFMERKQNEPFFVYYPMVLVHDPFVPTPDSEAWQDPSRRYEDDTTYFKDMVHYTDKIVGRIANKLRELEIAENTLIIFTGDNGTHPTVFTNTVNGKIQGGKGSPTNAGTLVPLVISWPEMIQSPQVHEELVEFNDFFATMADITEQSIETEGHSFKNLLTGNTYEPRKTAVVHYKPDWGKFKPTRFVRTKHYKLYEQGAFYNLQDDPLEQNELTEDQLNEEQQQIKQMLKDELTALPAF